MEYTFKSLSDNKRVDLIPYLKEKLSESEGISIYVGSDSQNMRNHTVYASVIVLHYNRNGGHVLYTRNKVDRIRDSFTRLWREVELSVEIAKYLEENGIQKAKFIDIDINPDPKYRSNTMLRSALGLVESAGFKPRCKPEACSASYVADRICH